MSQAASRDFSAYSNSSGVARVQGQQRLTLHTDTPEKFEYALKSLDAAWDIAPQGTDFTPNPIVLDRIA
jgi:hypothetical protein